MQLSPHTQAVLLLTAYLSTSAEEPEKPLSPREWSRLAYWLRDHGAEPASLLGPQGADLLDRWSDRQVPAARLKRLLDRGVALALALDQWQRGGIWVLTRMDDAYPQRLRRRLREDAPPVLFGCGHQGLLNGGGLAVVGSRQASDDDLRFTDALAARAAGDGFAIVSGGARGIDEAAMLGALDREGTAVGVVADGLLRAATSRKFRPHLMAKNLVLISPYHPEAGFSPGNAMRRNAYIYTIADGAVVVASDQNKGGTWAGATEALKAGWVPLWVRDHARARDGNKALIGKGARPLATVPDDVAGLLAAADATQSEGALPLLALANGPTHSEETVDPDSSEKPALSKDRRDPLEHEAEDRHGPESERSAPALDTASDLSLYELFILKTDSLLRKEKLNAKELSDRLDVTQRQAEIWLNRAMEENRIVKKRGKRTFYACAGAGGKNSLLL